MEIVFVKDNLFNYVKFDNIDGFKFKPRSNIKNLEIVDKELIRKILNKKINKDIDKSTKAIKLMLNSDITEIDDCNIMINELIRIANNIEKKYMKFFNEFEYFELIKEIYYLNMGISLKKKMIEGKI